MGPEQIAKSDPPKALTISGRASPDKTEKGKNKEGGGEKRITPPQRAAVLKK